MGAGNYTKLITTLNDKRDVVLHYRNIKQYTRLGLKLENVKRVLCFKQSRFLQQYILMTTALRAEARDEFLRTFAKLLINAVSAYFAIKVYFDFTCVVCVAGIW